jgi:hypothetical protein
MYTHSNSHSREVNVDFGCVDGLTTVILLNELGADTYS